MSVPGERSAVRAAAAVTATATLAVGSAALVAWNAREATAVVALVVSVAALALASAGLAAYILWLRQAVSRRMVVLLRPYLEPRVAPARSDKAGPTPSGLVLLATTAAG